MSRIRQRRDRHFIDEEGRLFWINGPDNNCYLSEQRQWRGGLSFDEILEWKQCAPSGLVSQRFASVREALESYEHGQVRWFQDLYLRRMGDQMASHRSADDYKPTALKLAEAAGGPCRIQPWRSGEVVLRAGAEPKAPAQAPASGGALEMAHPCRRRRSTRQLAEL
jgi:hypothetical protein